MFEKKRARTEVLADARTALEPMLDATVVAANRKTGNAAVVPSDYIIGVLVGLLLAEKALGDGDATGADVAQMALVAYAEAKEDDGE